MKLTLGPLVLEAGATVKTEMTNVYAPMDKAALRRAKSVLSGAKVAELADLLKLLGNRRRSAMIFALDQNELCANDLAIALGASKCSMKWHLKKLHAANVVRARQKEGATYYILDDKRIKKLYEAAQKHLDAVEAEVQAQIAK